MARRLWKDEELIHSVKISNSYSEAIRNLGLCHTGDAIKRIKIHIKRLRISTDHFKKPLRNNFRKKVDIESILTENSNFHRGHLKERLYKEGYKKPICELCGQNNVWRGKKIALILDHINGISNDNRIENLRIICPNCDATLPTFCGKKNKKPNFCLEYSKEINRSRYFCSRKCSAINRSKNKDKSEKAPYRKREKIRKVERPRYEVLLEDLRSMSCCAVGRKYGVSDNSIRKWIQWYKKEYTGV